MQPSTRERGFLLVEALVALAIAALMAALVFDTIWQMGRTATVAAQQRQALLLARSVLAAATVPGSGSPVPTRGSDGGFVWSITSEAYADEAADGLALRTVRVEISDTASGRPLARLTSLKAQQ